MCICTAGLYHDAVSQERHEGKWVADQRNGRGRASYASGAKFEGKPHHTSSCTLGCGRLYFILACHHIGEPSCSNIRLSICSIGTWVNGVRAGQGMLKYLNGDVFTGNFANGMKNGPGTFKKRQTATTINGVVSTRNVDR